MPGHPGRIRAIPGVGLPGSLASAAKSAGEAVSTAIPAAASSLQSAIGAAETSAIGALGDAIFPKNCSLGTKKFCFGFDSHTACSELPFDISAILQASSGASLGKVLQPLQSLESDLAKITPGYVEAAAITGLVLLFLMASLFTFFVIDTKFADFVCKLEYRRALFLRIGISLLCILLLIPYLVPVGILSAARSKIQGFGFPVADIKMGNLNTQLLENLLCALVIVLGIVIVMVLEPWRAGGKVRSPAPAVHRPFKRIRHALFNF